MNEKSQEHESFEDAKKKADEKIIKKVKSSRVPDSKRPF